MGEKGFKLQRVTGEEISKIDSIPSMCCSHTSVFLEDGEVRCLIPDGDAGYVVTLQDVPATKDWLLTHFGTSRDSFLEQLDPIESDISDEPKAVISISLPADICGNIGCVQIQDSPYMAYLSDTLCAMLFPGLTCTEAVVYPANLCGPLFSTVGDMERIESFL